MEGFNPDVKPSADGEAQVSFSEYDEQQERLVTPQEEKLLALSEAERQELLQDALESYSDLESLIHAITRMESDEQRTLF